MDFKEKRREYNRRVYLKKIGGNIKKPSKMSHRDSEILSYLGYIPKEEIKEDKQSLVKIYKILLDYLVEQEPIPENIKVSLTQIKI